MSYLLTCPACRSRFPDDGSRLSCPYGCVSLLQTLYSDPHAPLDESAHGIGRYHRRLPGIARPLQSGLPVVIDLPWLTARTPQLKLSVVFSGWWPERGAHMPSASFKDLEAAAVLARLALRPQSCLVLASAGNTAAAFASACTRLHRRCIIIVAASALGRIRLPQPQGASVTVIAIDDPATYDDAIALSRAIADDDYFLLEGGVRNVARRDGMGIALGVALERSAQGPDAYLQAIGSGAGAIAVWEAAGRAQQKRPELALPRLGLSQNAPFSPVTRSYSRQSPVLLADDPAIAKRQIAQIMAPVLSNMAPPYALPGGIFDALRASQGQMASVSNAAALSAWHEFREREGVALDGAAAVTLASLSQFPPSFLPAGSRVLVHLTGGSDLNDHDRPRIPLRANITLSYEHAQQVTTAHALRERLR